jgi:hypothetical protein
MDGVTLVKFIILLALLGCHFVIPQNVPRLVSLFFQFCLLELQVPAFTAESVVILGVEAENFVSIINSTAR